MLLLDILAVRMLQQQVDLHWWVRLQFVPAHDLVVLVRKADMADDTEADIAVVAAIAGVGLTAGLCYTR